MSLKTILLSALYIVLAILILIPLDLALDWFLNNVIFEVFDWFNQKRLMWKIIILVLGGTLFWGLLQLIARLSALLGGLIFNKLPQNNFTIITAAIISIANSIWCIVLLWRVPESFTFWIVCELIMMSIFIWTLSAIVMPAKQQIKNLNS